MSTLHQLNRLSSIDACRVALAPGDSILLFEEAVSLLLRPQDIHELIKSSKTRLYVVSSDAQARGIPVERTSDQSTSVSADDWVALCASHDRVVSW